MNAFVMFEKRADRMPPALVALVTQAPSLPRDLFMGHKQCSLTAPLKNVPEHLSDSFPDERYTCVRLVLNQDSLMQIRERRAFTVIAAASESAVAEGKHAWTLRSTAEDLLYCFEKPTSNIDQRCIDERRKDFLRAAKALKHSEERAMEILDDADFAFPCATMTGDAVIVRKALDRLLRRQDEITGWPMQWSEHDPDVRAVSFTGGDWTNWPSRSSQGYIEFYRAHVKVLLPSQDWSVWKS